MNTKTMIAGYEIEPHRESFSDPAHVTIHKLGIAGGRSWLTPDEALSFASAVSCAAKAARGEQSAASPTAAPPSLVRIPDDFPDNWMDILEQLFKLDELIKILKSPDKRQTVPQRPGSPDAPVADG